MESDTKLFISHHEGGRSTDDATELFNDFENKMFLFIFRPPNLSLKF